MNRLCTQAVSLGYDGREVVRPLTLEVPRGTFTAVVGANGCGKSTLLRGLARLSEPMSGTVTWDGTDVARLKRRDLATHLGFLPQRPVAPEAITVEGLVRRGRHPHRSRFAAWNLTDQAAVEEAMASAGVTPLADRAVAELSGGQAQRAWLAMVLAQQTDHLLLDEPTTFLDVAHQYDLLDLLDTLVGHGRTVVAVLHDLNQAARYADHLVAMVDGAVVAQGSPAEILTPALVREVFSLECTVLPDPVTGAPWVVPHDARSPRRARPVVAAPTA